MLRVFLMLGLALASAPALAQRLESVAGVKFGAGCAGPFSKFAAGLGTCVVDGLKSRIWCPNGQVFDRTGEAPQTVLVRSICNLSQVP